MTARGTWTGALAAGLGAWLALGAALAGPEPAPAPAAADGLDEIVVSAPEPRYVAPTRRDRIGRIWAPVWINDRGPFRLVLDTGASHSAVNAHVAEALSIDLATRRTVVLSGTTGSRTVAVIPVKSFSFGDIELRDRELPIITDALGGAEGVLGTEGLQDKRITIDFRHDSITIQRSHGERAPHGYSTTRLNIVNGLLEVADARVGGVRVRVIIDTGGQVTIANPALREALHRRLRAEDQHASTIIGATLDEQSGDRLSMPELLLGNLSVKSAEITVGDLYIFERWHMTKTPTLLVGMDLLGLFDVLVIDYKRRELQILTR